MSAETVLIRLPIKLLSAYGSLEGLATAAVTALRENEQTALADAIRSQLDEIAHQWEAE